MYRFVYVVFSSRFILTASGIVRLALGTGTLVTAILFLLSLPVILRFNVCVSAEGLVELGSPFINLCVAEIRLQFVPLSMPRSPAMMGP